MPREGDEVTEVTTAAAAGRIGTTDRTNQRDTKSLQVASSLDTRLAAARCPCTLKRGTPSLRRIRGHIDRYPDTKRLSMHAMASVNTFGPYLAAFYSSLLPA